MDSPLSKGNLHIGDTYISEWQHELGRNSWPEFMQHDAVVNTHWPYLYEEFLQFQIGLHNGIEPMAIANTIPLNWTGRDEDLPDAGLNWAMKKAVSDHKSGKVSNLLVAVQILVNPLFRGKEISYTMVDSMKELVISNNIPKIALPVRPTKHGQIFDPWLRVHLNKGGRISGICHKSMVIQGHVEDWKEWTGMDFSSTGNYEIEGALTPISIDLDKDTGIYIEPNVWIIYGLT